MRAPLFRPPCSEPGLRSTLLLFESGCFCSFSPSAWDVLGSGCASAGPRPSGLGELAAPPPLPLGSSGGDLGRLNSLSVFSPSPEPAWSGPREPIRLIGSARELVSACCVDGGIDCARVGVTASTTGPADLVASRPRAPGDGGAASGASSAAHPVVPAVAAPAGPLLGGESTLAVSSNPAPGGPPPTDPLFRAPTGSAALFCGLPLRPAPCGVPSSCPRPFVDACADVLPSAGTGRRWLSGLPPATSRSCASIASAGSSSALPECAVTRGPRACARACACSPEPCPPPGPRSSSTSSPSMSESSGARFSSSLLFSFCCDARAWGKSEPGSVISRSVRSCRGFRMCHYASELAHTRHPNASRFWHRHARPPASAPHRSKRGDKDGHCEVHCKVGR